MLRKMETPTALQAAGAETETAFRGPLSDKDSASTLQSATLFWSDGHSVERLALLREERT